MYLFLSKAIDAVAVACALYHIIINSGALLFFHLYMPGVRHSAVSLFLAIAIIYLKTWLARGSLRWHDAALMAGGLCTSGFVVFFYDDVIAYGFFGYLDLKGMVLAFTLAIVILETVRRRVGLILPVLLALAVVGTIFNNYLPGVLRGPGFSPDRMAFTLYAGHDGFFGIPLGIASTIVITFLILAQMLQESGIGDWFTKLAISLTGWTRGGPAKAAVLSSAFFGTMSGSPTGNCASTGAFTIPLMKSVGYSPAFAGAVESCSSAGGQILPPVMGAIIFVMAEWLDITYAEIAFAAALPASLYFITIFIGVDLEAAKKNLIALDRSELPNTLQTLKEGWFYLIPLAALIYFLFVLRLYPTMAGLYTIPLVIGCSFLSGNKNNRMYLKKILKAFNIGVQSWLTIAIVTAGIGMFIGPLSLSGVGIKISSFLLELTGKNFTATLVAVGMTALFLGMGMDSMAAYITAASLAAPALILLGMSGLAAHLFVIYWALASHITPPVCITVYVACGISGGNVWETGWQAIRLGVGKYLIPFVFAFSPALLLMGSTGQIVTVYILALIGLGSITMGFIGYSLRPLTWFQQTLFILAGLMLLVPNKWISLIGVGIVTLLILRQWRQRRFDEEKKPMQPAS